MTAPSAAGACAAGFDVVGFDVAGAGAPDAAVPGVPCCCVPCCASDPPDGVAAFAFAGVPIIAWSGAGNVPPPYAPSRYVIICLPTPNLAL